MLPCNVLTELVAVCADDAILRNDPDTLELMELAAETTVANAAGKLCFYIVR